MNRILVLASDTAIQLLLSDLLIEEGYDVVPMEDTAGFPKAARQAGLVLVDARWLGKDGFGRLQRLQGMMSGVPVIVVMPHFSFTGVRTPRASRSLAVGCADSENLKALVGNLFQKRLEGENRDRPFEQISFRW